MDGYMQYNVNMTIRTQSRLVMKTVTDCHIAVNPKQQSCTLRLPMSHCTRSFFHVRIFNVPTSVDETAADGTFSSGMVTAITKGVVAVGMHAPTNGHVSGRKEWHGDETLDLTVTAAGDGLGW